MSDRPSMYELWRQAGGGTSDYSRERYRELLIEHEWLIGPDHLEYDKAPSSLPCGWPKVRQS